MHRNNVKHVLLIAGAMAFAMASAAPSKGAPVQPNTVANLELWYRADSGPRTAGNPSLVNQTVDTWLDSSTAGNNGTGSATPILRSRTFNSHTFPVVEFSGGGDRFSTSPSFTNPAGSTYFVVFSQQGQSNSNGRFIAASNGGASFRNFTSFNNQLNSYEGTSAYSFSSNLQNSNFHIAVLHAQPNNPAIYLDGFLETVSTTLQGGPFPAYNIGVLNTLTVGASPGGTESLLGDIAEVLIYDRPLTAGQLNDVGFYLEDKYGINAAYVGVPEPSTAALSGLGVIGLAWRTKRRRTNEA